MVDYILRYVLPLKIKLKKKRMVRTPLSGVTPPCCRACPSQDLYFQRHVLWCILIVFS